MRSLVVLSLLAVAVSARVLAVPVQVTGAFAPSRGEFDADAYAQVHGRHALWDSRRAAGSGIGILKYGPFRLDREFALYVAGFPREFRVTFGWEDAGTGARLLLAPRQQPEDHWTLLRWRVPGDWRDREVFLYAEDQLAGDNDWIGISEPVAARARFGPLARLLGLHLLIFPLLLLPGTAGVAWLVRTRPVPADLALALMLIGSGLVAYATFFVFYFNVHAGTRWAWGIGLASAAGIVGAGLRRPVALPWRDLSKPLLLCFSAGLLYSAILFLYGGIEHAPNVSAERFLYHLPPDPLLPYWQAERLAAGQSPEGFLGDWLSSDRPPLQLGFELFIHPMAGSPLAYQVVGTILQTWVFLGLWILLRRARMAAPCTARVLFFVIFSGFFLLNGTFVWPKLLPAAYLLVAAAFLFHDPTPRGWLMGACAGLAMLGHGGSAFGAVGLAVVSLFRPPPRRWRTWGAAVLGGILVLLPWTLYQRNCAPPGNRLLKWHLAGVVAVDHRSFPEALRDAYGVLTVRQFLANKWGNFTRLFGLDDSGVVADLESAAAKMHSGQPADGLALAGNALRSGCFLNLFQSPGPLLLGSIGLFGLLRRRGAAAERELAWLMLALLAGITVVWCLLMFTARSSVNHQGSYFNNVCLFVALGIGACHLPRWMLWSLAALNLVWFFAVWILAPLHTHFTSALLPSADPVWAALILVAGLLTLALLFWLDPPGSTADSSAPTPGHNILGAGEAADH
ncbi:MAG TPA: hypothetical protein VHD61_01420 [Lacunisphaera sp.]|nr:hypothetical protein [Lacunisphaera sp.]